MTGLGFCGVKNKRKARSDLFSFNAREGKSEKMEKTTMKRRGSDDDAISEVDGDGKLGAYRWWRLQTMAAELMNAGLLGCRGWLATCRRWTGVAGAGLL